MLKREGAQIRQRVTDNPGSYRFVRFGLVPTNALVLTGLANFHPEAKEMVDVARFEPSLVWHGDARFSAYLRLNGLELDLTSRTGTGRFLENIRPHTNAG